MGCPILPVLSKENKEEYIKFTDNLIRTDLQDPNEEPELHKQLSDFQIHFHSIYVGSIKIFPVDFTLDAFHKLDNCGRNIE